MNVFNKKFNEIEKTNPEIETLNIIFKSVFKLIFEKINNSKKNQIEKSIIESKFFNESFLKKFSEIFESDIFIKEIENNCKLISLGKSLDSLDDLNKKTLFNMIYNITFQIIRKIIGQILIFQNLNKETDKNKIEFFERIFNLFIKTIDIQKSLKFQEFEDITIKKDEENYKIPLSHILFNSFSEILKLIKKDHNKLNFKDKNEMKITFLEYLKKNSLNDLNEIIIFISDEKNNLTELLIEDYLKIIDVKKNHPKIYLNFVKCLYLKLDWEFSKTENGNSNFFDFFISYNFYQDKFEFFKFLLTRFNHGIEDNIDIIQEKIKGINIKDIAKNILKCSFENIFNILKNGTFIVNNGVMIV